MLGDGREMPSRNELLSMVKKHSNSLGRTVADEPPKDDASEDVEFNPRFWHDVFDLYFVLGKESRGRQDDDLLFFVRKLSSQGYGFMEAVVPYFVRRWAAKLDMVVGESSVDVDWRRSFYLNLIAHTSFTVTVAICSHQDLQNHLAGQDKPLLPIYKVVKTVYASPSRVNFHLDSKKEVETTPAYPDICFAVDDFDSTFDTVQQSFIHVREQPCKKDILWLIFFKFLSRGQKDCKVLTETDHCFCVLLHANDGAAFPSNDANHAATSSIEKELKVCSSSNNSSLRIDTSLTKSTKLTLFSGFVSYKMVCDAYDAGKSRFGNLLSLGHSAGKIDRLYMKGPGGRGEVEVAVSGVVDQSQQDLGPFSPVMSNRRFGIISIFHKAATVASAAAKHAYAAAAATHVSSAEEMLPMKCCLMSISLPWEYIARDLLFKGTPYVNL